MYKSFGFTLILVVLATASPALGQAQCPADLVGYWPLDGNGEELVNGFPGVLVGNVQFVSGAVGQAARLDGNFSFIDAGTHPELAFGGTELTFSAWIKPEPDTTQVPGNDHLSVVVTSRTNCGAGNWQLYDRHGFGITPATYISKWTPAGPESFFQSGFIPADGQWTHIAVTLEDNVARFYVNGSFQEQVEDPATDNGIKADILNVQVGSDSCFSYFTGDLDDVAVYSTQLSDADVLALYLKGVDGLGQCTLDADGDGVADDVDVCPDTSGEALVDGCDCDQILAFKPGNGGQCNPGTLDVFKRRIGWAKNVPLPGSGQ